MLYIEVRYGGDYMDPPVIAGYGIVPVGEYWGEGLISLSIKAIRSILKY